jgi:hypothetical protein
MKIIGVHNRLWPVQGYMVSMSSEELASLVPGLGEKAKSLDSGFEVQLQTMQGMASDISGAANPAEMLRVAAEVIERHATVILATVVTEKKS